MISEDDLWELREEDRKESYGFFDNEWEQNGFTDIDDYYSWRGA